jgi:hypothetical protein
MMLADHAAATPDGKLYLNGAGWTALLMPTPFGIGLHVEVPWDRANEKHQFTLDLLDPDGTPAAVMPTPEGTMEPVSYSGEFETGRPAGMKSGTPVPWVHAVNFPPLAFQPDTRYVWQLTLNGEQDEDWRLGFTTAPTFPEIEMSPWDNPGR